MPIGLFVLIIIAILFPKFTRFVFTLVFFGFVFMVASCIDHQAKAADKTFGSITPIYQACTHDMAILHRAELYKNLVEGKEYVMLLVGGCGEQATDYMNACQKVDTTTHCFIDVKLMAFKAIQDSMN